MACFFCNSEITNNDIVEPSPGADMPYPLRHKCPMCIDVWLEEGCYDEIFVDSRVQDYRLIASECIRRRCEQSPDRHLTEPLSPRDIRDMITEYFSARGPSDP